MRKWNLDALYTGLDDESFLEDQKKIDGLMASLNKKAQTLDLKNPITSLKAFILLFEETVVLEGKLTSYLYLSLATDSINQPFNNALVVQREKSLQLTLPVTLFRKFVAKVEDLDSIIKQDVLLEEHRFFLEEIKDNSTHLLSDEEEVLAAAMNQSGGSLWTKMHTTLTSTLEVDYEGKTIPLSSVRNLAYDSNPQIRQNAYEAEKKSYAKIAKASAFALNGIKKEVITLSKKRQYASPLEETLLNSRINQDVLDALIQAMEESLPTFHAYLKRKATLLNHKGGLPFYDLFAPMGDTSHKKYTIEEAQAFILKHFASFSDDLKGLADRAFKEEWIDYTPRQNKQGGAFCARLFSEKESRVLTNFDGGIGDIATLAHELGHAYHNLCVYDEHFLNTLYPMPIAETASILCETIVKSAALKEAKTDEEKIGLLEQELQDANQVIVDILSRYYFETEVFKRVPRELLNESTLNQMMLQAQKDAYGDGLDHEFLNEGMWINKGHYYSTSRSFYNFPYAFGLLFAKGIYAQFQEKGAAFVPELKQLLRISGKVNLVDAAKSVGIDITDVAYWKKALGVVKADIDAFLTLTK